MKNNLFTTVLSWLLATSVILSVVFCLQFIFRTRELRRLQNEMARYQNTHQVLNILLNDLAQYSRRDPGITPILQSLGIRITGTNPPAATPPKPSEK
jgi:hypothetical protein